MKFDGSTGPKFTFTQCESCTGNPVYTKFNSIVTCLETAPHFIHQQVQH